MGEMKYLVGRNLAVFRSNRLNVFLSFFSIVIVMGLYVVFLREFIMQSVLDTKLDSILVAEFTDRLMIGGLLIVLNTTTCFGVMQLCVADASTGIQRDFLVAPVSKFQMIIGYWFTSIIVSFFFTCLTVIGGECFFYKQYNRPMSIDGMLDIIGVVFSCSVINSGILLCIMKFIKNTTAFSTFGNLYGMMSGFLAGCYLPYTMYPETLRRVLYYFPPMHLTSIMRQLYLRDLSDVIIGRGPGEMKNMLLQLYGVNLVKDGVVISTRQQWSFLIFSIALILIILRMSYLEVSGIKK